MLVLVVLLAILEISPFGLMGQRVDWLESKKPDTLWEEEAVPLIGMEVVVLIVILTFILLHALLVDQTLLGNYPKQSLTRIVTLNIAVHSKATAEP